MSDKGQNKVTDIARHHGNAAHFDTFVLDKGIFSNVFDKDIRRVYIYKKSERLAKAIHLIAPAFKSSPALKDRLDLIAVGLVDAAVMPPALARPALSKELLALSSVLSIARAGGMLSPMNADVIARESHLLLQEIAGYEEPRISFDESPSLAALARTSERTAPVSSARKTDSYKGQTESKGRPIVESGQRTPRREAILDVLKEKGPSRIKDISTVIRDTSEKTIQRELQAMVSDGTLSREGERRWTVYALKAA